MIKVLRIIIGLIFVASGFVKAVDPVGFSFKMEEYFAPGVFNLTFLLPFSLIFAVLISTAEMLLGVALIFKIKLKSTLRFLIALCIFFAFLTFYSAFFEKFTDCGCFGEAIKFTPWQSFIKDLILLTALIILWFNYRKKFDEERPLNFAMPAFLGSVAIAAVAVYFGIQHEPLIDFRDYKIGTDLKEEKEKIALESMECETLFKLKNKKSGEVIERNQEEYLGDKSLWGEDSQWEIVETVNITKSAGYQSEISKFVILDSSGKEITDNILNAPKAVILFCYNPRNADNLLINRAWSKILREENAMKLPVSTVRNLVPGVENATMDGTAIKTIARSNPFVLTLQNGKIVEKRSAKDYIKN